MHPQVVISLRDLRFGYEAGKTVLDGLTLDISTGTVTRYPRSQRQRGKTTLLNTVLGLFEPQGGEILIHGKKLSSYSRRDLSRVIGAGTAVRGSPFQFFGA